MTCTVVGGVSRTRAGGDTGAPGTHTSRYPDYYLFEFMCPIGSWWDSEIGVGVQRLMFFVFILFLVFFDIYTNIYHSIYPWEVHTQYTSIHIYMYVYVYVYLYVFLNVWSSWSSTTSLHSTPPPGSLPSTSQLTGTNNNNNDIIIIKNKCRSARQHRLVPRRRDITVERYQTWSKN